MSYRCLAFIAGLAFLPFTMAADSVDVPALQRVVEQNFKGCLQRFQQQALAEGYSESLVQSALADLQPVTKVIVYDRRQPEFSQSFHGYFSARVTERAVNKGRKLLAEHRILLDQLTRDYGVPAQYLIAFWGLETNFGGYMGKMQTLDSLATLACDQRRSTFFTNELLSALAVIRDHKLDPKSMRGSWAGAVGHTQFMPSAYVAYAVDGDGDGRADLWNSIPDALTSGANFLQQLGWKRDLRWGREVQLPVDFDYALAGRDLPLPLASWIEQGVRTADGLPLVALDLDAAVVIPSGHRGPAFLAYDNFKVIMRWNRSEFYALAVGHFADRINGGGALNKAPLVEKSLSIKGVKNLQLALNQQGFDAGKADGILGSKTRIALRGYQASINLIADGFPDTLSLKALNIDVEDR
ncbi:MAG: membrane-bound lytic murein transglycosylase B [Pseudohongiellaceae bacterium]|jgi:membrane-bound lytic murein transglycosylase B